MEIPTSGLVVDIVGTEAGNRGRFCEEHDVCGSVLELDYVIKGISSDEANQCVGTLDPPPPP
jgi:hypothetical protein